MAQLIVPAGYKSRQSIRETEIAIKQTKDFFERELARQLNLTRVSAPLFVRPETGLNDNLNGVERPVRFGIREQNDTEVEVVHSLAKWKRMVGGQDYNLFRALPAEALAASVWKIGDGSVFALPAFSLPKVSWAAVIAIMPIAIATIPESTAHVYQLDIYVNDVAKSKGVKKKYDLASMLDRNLIGDGLCDMVTGLIGGPAGTNYGENISTMAISRVFSVPVLIAASVIAMIVSCFTPLIGVIYGIPLAVIGGLEIYLFGAIAAQGIAIMIDKKCDMFSSKNIAVIASIMVIGLGTQYVYGGTLNFFGLHVPAVAGAAIFGIVLNLLLSIGDKKEKAQAEEKNAE